MRAYYANMLLAAAMMLACICMAHANEQQGMDFVTPTFTDSLDSFEPMMLETAAAASCPGVCQATNVRCASNNWQKGLCPGSKVCCARAAIAPARPVTPAAPVVPAAIPAAPAAVPATPAVVPAVPAAVPAVPAGSDKPADPDDPDDPSPVHAGEGTHGEEKPTPTLPTLGDQRRVDSASEKRIATLHPKVQPYARAFLNACKAMGYDVRIVQALRSVAEQNKLYAQGRTARGKVVTNARGGYSNHNFGTAFDVGVFKGGKYIDSIRGISWREIESKYSVIAPLARQLGLEWGGDWETIEDKPHYQLRPTWAKKLREGQMLEGMRDRTARRKDIFAA